MRAEPRELERLLKRLADIGVLKPMPAYQDGLERRISSCRRHD
jgi:hypothetical protein